MHNITVMKFGRLWDHTVIRVENAEKQSKDYQDFVKKMVLRLRRIKHEEKIHYAIAVLEEKGYHEVVDIYKGRLLMNKMSKVGGSFF